MAEADLDISTARIVTDARRVRDSFYVQREGRKVKDELEQEEIRKGLHNAIHPRSTAEAKEVRYETS
jgi:UTP:GlnB (protein PII) uridylyltransferase